jgi:hypothetical protein
MLWIDHKYIGLLSSKLDRFVRKTDKLYNMRCPICGDSHKNKHKARGYLFEGDNGLFYKCHNCGFSGHLSKLIEQVDPHLYQQYQTETFAERHTGRRVANTDYTPFFEPKKPTHKGEGRLLEYTVRVSDLPTSHPAVLYLQGRRIPESRWNDLFYAEDYSLLEQLRPDVYEGRLLSDERIVIPFRNREGKLIGVQGRSISGSPTRYVTIRLTNDDPLIYGLESIDTMEPIYVVEGPIDSMFLPNAVACGGSDLMRAMRMLPKGMVTLVFDNQPRNKDLIKLVEKASRWGYSVFIWPNHIHSKDINDLILEGCTPDEITSLINTNTHNDLALRLAIRDWKKI